MKDRRRRALVKARLDRVSLGSFGDYRSLGGRILELRVHFGPGYRIYFGMAGNDVILLWGGEKRTQARDIARAKIYWTEYGSRTNA